MAVHISIRSQLPSSRSLPTSSEAAHTLLHSSVGPPPPVMRGRGSVVGWRCMKQQGKALSRWWYWLL